MWLPSAELLKAETQAQSVFIAQLWHELLSPNSPDSFRAKALDLPLLMEELLRICGYALQEPKWISHVHLICEEIKSHLPIPERLMISPVAESALISISTYKLGQPELPRLVEQAQIFLDLTPHYIEELLNSARQEANKQHKKQLTVALGSLATHVQSIGAGAESILKIDDEICSLRPEEVIDKLCGDVNRKPRDYLCYVAITAPRPIASKLFSNLPLREVGGASFSPSPDAQTWYKARDEGIVVEWSINSTSRLKAAESALSEVFSLIHLHALYGNKVIAAASPRVLVKEGHDFFEIEVTPSRHFGLKPRRDSERLARERYIALGPRFNGRLANLLESHALAVSASDARSAVFHLWTALETLASGLGSGTIGERVANVVAPIVAWRRIDKIATYLAINGNELRNHMGMSFDLTHMPHSSDKHIDRLDIFLGITGKTDNPVILDFFKAFKESPLLLHRLYRAWEEYSSSNELRKTLILSKDRIRWQVMRFYRTRNLLVHYGELDDFAMRLLENAQYYLSTCVGRVLHDMMQFCNWDVNTSLEYQRHRFDSLLTRLQSDPHAVRVKELLLYSKENIGDKLVWPPPAKTGQSK